MQARQLAQHPQLVQTARSTEHVILLPLHHHRLFSCCCLLFMHLFLIFSCTMTSMSWHLTQPPYFFYTDTGTGTATGTRAKKTRSPPNIHCAAQALLSF